MLRSTSSGVRAGARSISSRSMTEVLTGSDSAARSPRVAVTTIVSSSTVGSLGSFSAASALFFGATGSADKSFASTGEIVRHRCSARPARRRNNFELRIGSQQRESIDTADDLSDNDVVQLAVAPWY